MIADNLSKAGWSWGCVSSVHSRGRTIWIADAQRGDGKRFVVPADGKLTACLKITVLSPLNTCGVTVWSEAFSAMTTRSIAQYRAITLSLAVISLALPAFAGFNADAPNPVRRIF